MKLFPVLGLVFCYCVFGLWQAQAMTSLNYQIPWDSINTGGNESGTSTAYLLYDTIGQTGAGVGTSTSYRLENGYREPGAEVRLSFIAYGQSASISTEYSLFDTSPTRVTVSSVTGFSAGDYIAVIQDRGYGALVAVGRITSVGGSALTVDRWDGDSGLMAGVPAGGDDVVVKLDSAAVPFGTMTVGSERTAVVGGSVQSSAVGGHTVYLQANGNLALEGGVGSITPVTDGTVSSSAEEYGAETIGPRAVAPMTDLGVTSTLRAIVTSPVSATTVPDRFALLFKLGVTSATAPGAYSQTIYVTLTSNF